MKKFGTYAALGLVCVLLFFPFYWVVVSSLKSVQGMSLEPPTLLPAERLVQDISLNGKVVTAEGATWFELGGGFYLQLKDGKATSLVKQLAPSQPARDAGVRFEKVPVIQVDKDQIVLLAKKVTQKEVGFDEVLFCCPKQGGKIKILDNARHEEIRYLSIHPENYAKALAGPEATIGGKSAGFLLFMRNSLFIAVLTVFGQLLSSSLVAFGFARTYFKGRDVLFAVLLATLMVPAQVTLIPLFVVFKSIGWLDTFLPLIVPHFTAGAFNVFLIRQFMLGIPRELDESAKLDGAGLLTTYLRIILPNCKPVLIVVVLFSFVAAWQDVLGPLIYLDSPEKRTISLGLEYFRSPYVDNRTLLMAGAVLSMLPIVGLFLVAQRYILAGIATTGLKG